ncbi:cytochrome P450 [Cristinia sonorae]|uniref:Cytochrome P450 n=1 Tax=Cristinia sonorae TaxID=1940300 RepID=A0A8K0UUL8_9AGAR|nr:cytochrome P450 [Cristinia sonorae]
MLLTLAISLASITAIFVLSKSFKRQLPLPPGPPRRWLVGNLLDFPRTRPWLTFRDWCKEYGDLVFIDLPLKPVVVIGSTKVASDLLEAKSNINSERPHSVIVFLLTWEWAIPLAPYTPRWRTGRRYFHQHFNRSVLNEYRSVLEQETHAVLSRLLTSPELARQHIRTSISRVQIIRVVYGARNAARMREYVDLAERTMESVRRLLVPGAFLAELIPALKYIPAWLPGGYTKRFVSVYQPLVDEMRNRPFDEVKEAIANAKAIPSVSYRLIQEMQDSQGNLREEDDQIARDVTGSAYAAAADTTTATSQSFVLAMAMNPHAQKKAQEELDRVVGPSRLPDFSDLDSLPYVRAVMLETLRWIPTVPVGVAHALTEDDVYEGYHIPKGTVVVAVSVDFCRRYSSTNVTEILECLGMLHNPEDYPEPEAFKPERFLDKDGRIDPSVRDPTIMAFGFGRRICAGMDFALHSLNTFMACMLHVYEMKPGVDEHGQPVVLTSEGSDDAISFPVTFPRHIKPRSAQAERLIRDIVLAEVFD